MERGMAWDSAMCPERRSAPPQVGASVVILALGPEGDTGNSAAGFRQCRELGPFPSLVAPGQARPSAVPGCWALPGGDLRPTGRWNSLAYAAPRIDHRPAPAIPRTAVHL